jgi:hypothetical protein
MVVRPRDGRGVPVVAQRARIDVRVVELVDVAHRPEAKQASAQVLVVAGGQQTAPILPEPHDGVGFRVGQTVTDIDGQQPQLVVTQLVDTTHYGVIGAADLAITCGDLVAGGTQLVSQQ